jgi:hypothetical protein
LGLPLPPEGIMGGCDYLSIISQKKIFKDEISLKCPEFLGYLYLQNGRWDFAN